MPKPFKKHTSRKCQSHQGSIYTQWSLSANLSAFPYHPIPHFVLVHVKYINIFPVLWKTRFLCLMLLKTKNFSDYEERYSCPYFMFLVLRARAVGLQEMGHSWRNPDWDVWRTALLIGTGWVLVKVFSFRNSSFKNGLFIYFSFTQHIKSKLRKVVVVVY